METMRVIGILSFWLSGRDCPDASFAQCTLRVRGREVAGLTVRPRVRATPCKQGSHYKGKAAMLLFVLFV